MKYINNSSKKSMRIALIIPTSLCIVILLALLWKYVYPIILFNIGNVQVIYVDTAQTEIDLLLCIVGIAISVWIGLNIYNIISKKELEDLLEIAKQSKEISESIFTETLVSKLRLSYSDDTAIYFANRLEKISYFPTEILARVISIEDGYSFAYKAYRDGVSVENYIIGEKQANDLIDYIRVNRRTNKINSDQSDFLLGYANLRLGDFCYFRIQFEENESMDNQHILVEKCVGCYKKCLKYLFGIRNVKQFGDADAYSIVEQQCLAFIANSIGSIYLVSGLGSTLTKKELDEALSYELITKKFSAATNKRFRAMFARNLGVAYERIGRYEEAFQEYVLSFNLDHLNWKTAHCLGAWYRKNAQRLFPILTDELIISKTEIVKISRDEKKKLLILLEKAAYWYEKERKLEDIISPWLAKIYLCIYLLSKDETAKTRYEMIQKEQYLLNLE